MSFWRAQSKGGCRYGSWVLTCLAPLGWTGEGAGPHTLPSHTIQAASIPVSTHSIQLPAISF